jgi:hypothetical protein
VVVVIVAAAAAAVVVVTGDDLIRLDWRVGVGFETGRVRFGGVEFEGRACCGRGGRPLGRGMALRVLEDWLNVVVDSPLFAD